MDKIVTLDEIEKLHCIKVLDVVHGNISEAAKHLGIDRRTLHRKMKEWGYSSLRLSTTSRTNEELSRLREENESLRKLLK